MGVMLQAFYRRGTGGVPSPADGPDTLPWWWDHLAAQAQSFRQAGFSALWLPPVLKGAAGTLSVGYDVFDDYDLGAKPQHGTIPTRYGTREQLTRCVATLRACGLDVYLDLVENQRGGGISFRYRYRDADGGNAGRFPKDPESFHPNVPQDPGVFGGKRIPELSFGDDLAIINAKPRGSVSQGLVAGLRWKTRALDIQGYRLDNAKGISTQFVPKLLNDDATAGRFAVGEFFDGDLGLLETWMRDTGRRSTVFDFPLRFTLARMCNQPGGFDMGGTLDHPGLTGIDPLMAVTFVENHDTDTRAELQPVVTNKLLAYAYILTSEGYPCVFYKDYSTDRGCYGLKPRIDNLIWIHEKLAAGPTQERWKDVGLFVFERLGGPHLLVGLNKDDWQGRTVTVDTGFGPHTRLHDYTGHSPDTWTDGAGRATIRIPANRDGLGYSCFSRDGQGFGFDIGSHAVTQELEGAPDLDIGPATDGPPRVVGRIWIEKGKAIRVRLTELGGAALPAGHAVVVEVRGPTTSVPLKTERFTQAGAGSLLTTAAVRGWHSIAVSLDGVAAGSRRSFTLAVTYTAPIHSTPAELRA